MRMIPLMRRIVLLAALGCLVAGCSALTPSQTKVQQGQDAATKVLRVGELYEDILSKAIKVGASQDEIESRYGKPDDIFRSSSSVSSLEIWTYERTPPDKYNAFSGPDSALFPGL